MAATLVSPGVEVTIVDESFYSSVGPGTVPLIVFATAANKASPSGSGIAPYSAPSEASQLYLATSQRDLIQNFGTPTFKNVNGTPVHGYETNEYGLMAAYQYLGIANKCYVLRADIDLSQLSPSTTAPVCPPANGTYWFDIAATSFGVFQCNGNPVSGSAWTQQNAAYAAAGSVVTVSGVDVPSPSFGYDGQFVVVVTMSNNLLYQRISGTWYQVGSSAWKAQYPTTVVGNSNPGMMQSGDTFTVNGVEVLGANVGSGAVASVVTAYNAAVATYNSNAVTQVNVVASVSANGALVFTETTGNALTIADGSGTPLATRFGITSGTTLGVAFLETNTPQYPAGYSAGSVWIKGNPANGGASWSVQVYSSTTGAFSTVSAPFYPFNAGVVDGTVGKDAAALAAFGTPSAGTVYVGYDVTTNGAIGTQQLRIWNGTYFINLDYQAGTIAPTSAPAAGTYWYNTDFQVDIMYGTGANWLGYSKKYPLTDPNGPILSGSQPTTQSSGAALQDNDLWVDTSSLENYPMIYRYSTTTQSFTLIDNADNTSPFGIIFQDARQDSGPQYGSATGYNFYSTAITDMVLSNYCDPDCPDPRTYPDGMLLWNTRYSTYNVKEYEPTWFNAGSGDFSTTDYTVYGYNIGDTSFPPVSSAARWVTASGNMTTGAPYMGRKAQRVLIVKAIEAELIDNQDIRSEIVFFNLVACPGYPELMPEMISLNTDIKNVAFNIGDTPIRLQPTGTAITQWATNGLDVAVTGEDGLTVSDPYTGVYYPWGLSNDLSGNEIMIPPSAIALVTIAYNDQVAYPWFAPAGYNRGLVTNASSVGYLTASGTYQPTILNQGQRDVLYENNINPIAYIPGRGLVVFGQKTLDPESTSALSRINVARLVNYLSYNLNNIVQPFLFQPNTAQTQAAASAVVSSFLNGIVGLQGLQDYAVVCDSTNNTPTTINENQLWIDVAVIPTYAIEFIYIPVRILATGASLASNVSSTGISTGLS